MSIGSIESCRKTFQSREKADKEAAVLILLSCSTLKDLIPIVFEVSHRGDLSAITMSFLSGLPISESELNVELMYILGMLTKRVHQIGKYHEFGLLDHQLVVQQPVNQFSKFVNAQILKWRGRHHFGQHSQFVTDYANWLLQQLVVLAGDLNQCIPVFCHGDFDLKNLLVQSGEVIGLVDWEHAGSFCLEWEWRKLSRFCTAENGFFAALFEGYFERLPFDYEDRLRVVRYLDAADLLGHLGWCLRNGLAEEYTKTVLRMNEFYPQRRR